MIWFTSDFHIGDLRMLNKRGFVSLDEMASTLIDNYNSLVAPDDEVWLLGDMAGDIETACKYMPRLNGKKSYVVGNHDRKWIGDKRAEELFEQVVGSTVITIDDATVHLSHYPLYEWYKSKYGGALIHGHMHGEKIEDSFYASQNAIDVSVDNCRLRPMSWEDIVSQFKAQGKSLYRGRR